MLYATDVLLCGLKKRYFIYVAVPGIELSLSQSDSVSLSVTDPTQSARALFAYVGIPFTGNCNYLTLQCVKHSCQYLVS